MSLPTTDAEREQAQLSQRAARPAENLVSTACPDCGTRFALLASYVMLVNTQEQVPVWLLRCTVCGFKGNGELKHG